MEIILKDATDSKIKELEHSNAFTWEGMALDRENLNKIAELFIDEDIVKRDTVSIIGYTWKGHTMNCLYNLHGTNRCPDDLPFFCFGIKSFNGSGNLNVFKIMNGARWLDDIVRNNKYSDNFCK